MKKTTTKKTVKLWIEIPAAVAYKITAIALRDSRKRKPYIEKLVIDHSAIYNELK